MAVEGKLPFNLVASLRRVEAELEDFVTFQRDAFGEMSERWLESERASNIEAWLDDLDETKQALADIRKSYED